MRLRAAVAVLLLAASCSEKTPIEISDAAVDGAGGRGGGGGAGGAGGAGGSGCTTPNPSQACRTSAGQCLPSSCACNGGKWLCTEDCGGGRNCGDGGAPDAAACPPTCFRAISCVTSCGATPVSVGCCACVAPAFDDISCPPAFTSFLWTEASGPCPPNSDCSEATELLASGVLRKDCDNQLPVVVHEAMVSAADRDAAIAILSDKALVALLDQPGAPCQPPTDVFESMTLVEGGRTHKNSVTVCPNPPIASARKILDALVEKYLPNRCPP
jgi:hypothetical protein